MSDKLKIDVINKLLKFCFSSIETNQYSTMISFANEQDKKRTKGYVLITEIIFYLFEIDKNQEAKYRKPCCHFFNDYKW